MPALHPRGLSSAYTAEFSGSGALNPAVTGGPASSLFQLGRGGLRAHCQGEAWAEDPHGHLHPPRTVQTHGLSALGSQAEDKASMLTKARGKGDSTSLALSSGPRVVLPTTFPGRFHPGPHQTSLSRSTLPLSFRTEFCVPPESRDRRRASRGRRCVCWRCSLDGSKGHSGGSGPVCPAGG